MLVQDWMSTHVISIDVNAAMQEAVNLTVDHRINMLPVMEQGKLVGVVTDRDLRRAAPSDTALLDIRAILYHLSRVEIRSIMTPNPVTVPPDFTLEETAEILLKRKISGCPVVDEHGEVIGIITEADLFKAIISLSGLARRGLQFGFIVDDRRGSIKEITDIVREYGGRLVSLLTSYEGAPEGKRFLYLRAFDIDRSEVPAMIERLRFTAPMLYMVDHRDNIRQVYPHD